MADVFNSHGIQIDMEYKEIIATYKQTVSDLPIHQSMFLGSNGDENLLYSLGGDYSVKPLDFVHEVPEKSLKMNAAHMSMEEPSQSHSTTEYHGLKRNILCPYWVFIV